MYDIKTELTEEELIQKHSERLAKLRPLDDDFMRELFRDNKPLAQFVLRILTGKKDLILVSEETQYDAKRLMGAKSVCLDVMATDSQGRKYGLEIQRADKGASPYRARYHSSAMDIEFLSANQNFDDLPITYVIFITENDVRGKGFPLYPIERMDIASGEPFEDGEHIIFINGAYCKDDDKSDLAMLIHDFNCSRADDMHFDLMAERTRYYKENRKGVSDMCKILEEMCDDTRIEEKVQIALNLLALGTVSKKDIATVTGLSVEKINELANSVNKPA